MDTLTARFREIVNGLRATIGAHVGRTRVCMAVFTLLWTRLGRTIRRIESLFAQWQAGTLRTPCPSRPARPSQPRDPALRLPRGRGWVVAHVGYHAGGRASQLQHLLAEPAMAEFLHAVPQAARLLRPLVHILGIDPSVLPKPPVKPRLPAPAGQGVEAGAAPRPARSPRREPVGPRRRPTRLPAPTPTPITPPPRYWFG